jgi:tetratricopeptide (TPR) repeat protein
VTVAGALEWTTALESCRDQQWSKGLETLTGAISAYGPERGFLVARATCRLMQGDESGAIVDLCAAASRPAIATDKAAFEQLAQACGEAPATAVMRLVGQEVPGSGIELHIPPPKPVKPAAKPRPSSRPGESLVDRWKQESVVILDLVQSDSWRDAEKKAQAFLTLVERTVPGPQISATELSKLLADVEALLMAVHCDHSADLLEKGNPALALIFARRAGELLGAHQDSAHVVAVRTAAARSAIALGVVQEALDELEEASRHVKTRAERAEVGQLLAQLGDLARDQHVWILAISAYRLAADMYRQSETGDDSARVLALMLEAAARRISEHAASSPG